MDWLLVGAVVLLGGFFVAWSKLDGEPWKQTLGGILALTVFPLGVACLVRWLEILILG